MNLCSLYLQRVFQKQLFQRPFYALSPRAPTVNRKQKPFLHLQCSDGHRAPLFCPPLPSPGKQMTTLGLNNQQSRMIRAKGIQAGGGGGGLDKFGDQGIWQVWPFKGSGDQRQCPETG